MNNICNEISLLSSFISLRWEIFLFGEEYLSNRENILPCFKIFWVAAKPIRPDILKLSFLLFQDILQFILVDSISFHQLSNILLEFFNIHDFLHLKKLLQSNNRIKCPIVAFLKQPTDFAVNLHERFMNRLPSILIVFPKSNGSLPKRLI